MAICRNPNHPKKGESIKSDPIRKLEDIAYIKRRLESKPRDWAIFVIGINSALRASDLVRLTVGMVRQIEVGEHFRIIEKKTRKPKEITVNRVMREAIHRAIECHPNPAPNAPLFPSRKGGTELTVEYLCALVKGWCKDAKLKGNFSSHTLRRTFGHTHYAHFGTGIEKLMILLNHRSQKDTLQYIGVQAEDLKEALMQDI